MLFFLSLYAANAGDILRGGFSARTAPANTSGSGNTVTVARLRASEQDVLSRTTQALRAVQAMQGAARNIAQNGPNNLGLDPNHPGQQLPNVPNGLTTGGLQVAPGATANSALWQNANLPTQSASNGQTTVTITQTAPKAILTWQTFNVGRKTTADFDQSAGTQNGTNNWIALNRVLDPTGVPSQILGSIKADGQIYLINRNGIIFGGGSQVNVNTLIASTLNIPDAAFNVGFLAYTANNSNSSAVFSTSVGNAGPTAGNSFAAFSRFYQNSDTGAPIPSTNAPGSADVVVQPGSSITTSESGRVILLGAHVKNGGTISTPDGQTILAAGDSAYLYADPTPQMRGLSVDVLIDPNTNNTKVNPLADPTAGTTTNSGLITVGKGNATLDGAIIAQNGVISALTGVDFNGSIILTARYAPDTSAEAANSGVNQLSGNYISPTIPGAVTLGPYSVTQVLPDLSDPTTTLDAQGFNPSIIVVQGKTVTLEGASFPGTPSIGSDGRAISPGALLIAPGGTVSVTAPVSYGILSGVSSNFAKVFFGRSTPFIPIYAASADAGAGARIFIDSGSTIDVSGTQDVSVPVSRNVVTVNLRANELRDSPLQRNGPLYGKNINVDISVTGTNADGSTWYGTPFADASGYIALIGRDVAERTAIGGAVNLVSAGDVVAVNGSTMNVSGGWLDYQSGIVATTRLLGTDGHLYDIANADPNLTYVGIAGGITITHPRWGVTETFSTPLVSSTDQRSEQGYLDGRSAGSIAITANKMVLAGTLLGNSVSGPRQRTINANVDSSVPLGGSLTLQAPPDTSSSVFYTNAIQDNLTFVTDHAILTPDQALALSDGTLSLSEPSIDRGQTLLLPADIFSAGGFTTFSTEVSTQLAGTNAVASTVVKTTSPFLGDVLLPQSVALDFGTAASATLNINYDGTVARNADGTISTVSVNLNNSANVTVDAYGNVDLEGSITAPAGKIAFRAGVLYALKNAFDSSYLANPPSITVGSIQGSTLTFQLRGLWTNETGQPPDNSLQPLWINGGSFSLSAPGALTISAGSLFDVTGGGRIHANGQMASSDQGKGGSLSFLGDVDPYLAGNNNRLNNNELEPVAFNGTFLAYGMGGDGSLALGAGAIYFTNGAGTSITGGILNTSAGPTPGIIVPAGLVAQGGFSSYTFASATDLTVSDGTQLLPTQKVLTSADIQKRNNAPSGSDIYAFTSPFLQPQFERKPTSITLTANTTITVGEGANIQTDPGASITLKATPLVFIPAAPPSTVAAGYVNILGTLNAPAGVITLDAGFPVDAGTLPASSTAFNTIYLGPHSIVSADGASLLTVDALGHRVGTVLNGGSVNIQNTLYFIAKPGSLIDVSGTEATLDLATGRRIGIVPQYAPSVVASSGGSISISGLNGLFMDGTLNGRPGDYGDAAGSVATGGSLVIQALGQPVRNNNPDPPFISYENGGLIISQDAPSPLATAVGSTVTPSSAFLPGAGFVSAKALEAGAFDSVALQAVQFIQFVGNVTLTLPSNLELHAPGFAATATYSPTGNYSTADNPTVTLSASHLWLDGSGASNAAGTNGPIINKSVLKVRATTLDLDGFDSGRLSQTVTEVDGTLFTEPALPSFGKVNFSADGDLRFVGAQPTSLTSAGSAAGFNSNNFIFLNSPVTFHATQIYPLSGVAETIVDSYQPSDPADSASITFIRSSPTEIGTTPLSAGGSVAVFAPTIIQGGVIKASLGAITFGSNTGLYTDFKNNNFVVPITQSLTLTPVSVTSTSLDDNVVPYGTTTASGSAWYFANADPQSFTESVPAGVMTLSGAHILIQADARTGGRAIINGSGGGDLYAYEFVPGVGGSNDVLNQPSAVNAPGVYAILPTYDQYSLLGSPTSVFNGANVSPDKAPQYGQMIHVSGVAGLPAGDYVLLPAHYALLPGGYRVTLASSNISALAQNIVNPNGSYSTLGYFETVTTPGTRANGSHNPWQQFSVQSGAVVRQNSQYLESSANTFVFKDLTTNNPISPLLPEDAGQLVVSPLQTLDLDGEGIFNHAPGTTGGRVDLNISRDVAIVGTGGTDGTTGASGADYGNSAIVLKASALNDLNAQSILIGGARQVAANSVGNTNRRNETYIVAATSSITVDNGDGTALQAPEIILASSNLIDLTPTAIIKAVGAVAGASTGDLNFVTDFGFIVPHFGNYGTVNPSAGPPTGAPGSLVRVSDGAAVKYDRFGAANSSGNLIIEPGSQLISGNAILIEGDQSATLETGALLQAPSIYASGYLVSLGAVPGSVSGLDFSSQIFESLQATRDLTLFSQTSIDFWGSVSLGGGNLANLVLDAGQLSNRTSNSTFTVNASNITIQATDSYHAGNGITSGSLVLNATRLPDGSGGVITIGEGAKYIDGFSSVGLTAARQIVLTEAGTLSVPGSLAFTTPQLTAMPNAYQQISATGAFLLNRLSSAAQIPATDPSLNSLLSVAASTVTIGGLIQMHSGVVQLEATTGDVVLNSGGAIDVSGAAAQFYDQYRYVAGGQVDLVADAGNVTLAPGTTINVSGFLGTSGIAGGGDAGTISVTAGARAASPATGFFTSQGQLLGSAAPGNLSGSFVLNVGSIADFTGLNAELNAGGFAQSRNFRVRTGTVVLGGGATAHTFILSADAGNIDVQGTIDASGSSGGTIFLAANGNVTLEPGSLLDAHATTVAVDAYGKPIDPENEAHVEIDTVSGTLNLAGGTINVSVPGADAVTGQSFGGDVHLRASLIANGEGDSIQVSSIGNIIGANSIDLEAYQSFTPNLGVIDNALVGTIQTAFAGFSGTAPSIAGLANLPVGIVHFRPGVEIDYNGDIAIEVTNDTDPNQSDVNGVGTAGWDFSTWRYNNEPGYLTVRAAGNLTVANSMSDGFTGVTSYSFVNNPANPKASYYSTQTTGPSWGFTLVSGAALGAADRRQVQSPYSLGRQGNFTSGNFTLASDNYIRTGTGDITIAVGGNLTLANELSTIYTAGIPIEPINPAVEYYTADGNINPAFNPNQPFDPANNPTPNPINFPTQGGNIDIFTQGSITAAQTPQLITDWLWRQGGMNPATTTFPAQAAFYTPAAWGPIFGLAAPVWLRGNGISSKIISTSGDYSFAQGIGALAGGNITINAGGSITDLSAVIASNGYQTSATGNPTNASNLTIQGGGDLIVRSGGNIGVAPGDLDMKQNSSDAGGGGGVYYVARGRGDISTVRLTSAPGSVTAEMAMDDAVVSVRNGGDLKLAPFDPMVENQVFANRNNFSLAPLNPGNALTQMRSYEFGDTSRTDLDETSLTGDILPAFSPFNPGAPVNVAGSVTRKTPDYTFLHHEWADESSGVAVTGTLEYGLPSLTGDQIVVSFPGTLYQTVQVLPTNMQVTAFAGAIFAPNSQQDLNANSKFGDAGYQSLGASFQFPAARGSAEYLAYGDISDLPALSDAAPADYPTLLNPQAYAEIKNAAFLSQVLATIPQGVSVGALPNASQVHSPALLHSGDSDPVRIYSVSGNVLFNAAADYFFEIPKLVWIKAALDVSITLNSASIYNQANLIVSDIHTTPQWIQNLAPSDTSVIEAGQDVDLNVRVDGPGTLYVQAGRDILPDTRILSEGNGDDNALPVQGANLTVLAGLDGIGSANYPNYAGFIQAYFNPVNAAKVAANYLDTVETALNLPAPEALAYLEGLPPEQQAAYVLPAYFNELKMSGRNFNNPVAPDFGSYRRGFAALDLLFPAASYLGAIDLSGALISGIFVNGQITTVRGGNIQLLAPGGPITVGQPNGTASLNSGLTTVRGGSISTYSAGSVEVNQSRLATLGGGDILIWAGNTDPAKVPNPPFNQIANIDAGKGSKTELVAPPQSFLIDNATADIGLDPAAVATGNGIATLPAVKGAPPSDIDLIAPDGTVNASDAGIRVSGNFSVAALHVVTNGNVTVAGTSVGVPTVVAPNIGGLTAASNTAGASSNASEQVANQAAAQTQQQDLPSLITVEVLGYGGGG